MDCVASVLAYEAAADAAGGAEQKIKDSATSRMVLKDRNAEPGSQR